MLTMLAPTTTRELDDTRALMRDLTEWHRERHHEDLALIDSYFDPATFDAELAALPGKFAPPDGRLYLAYNDGVRGGCVALRNLGDGACEMKRMFVPAAQRGNGFGRALARKVVEEARNIGYARLLLDTSWRQKEAISLYESLGFERTEPYYELSDALKKWLVFFELKLA